MEIITEGYTRRCKDSLGGLDKIYLFTFKNYSRSQILVNDNVLETFPPTTIYAYDYIGNPAFNNNEKKEDEGNYFDEDLSFQLAKVIDNNKISKLLKQDLRAIVKDKNGFYRILGLYNGLECDSINSEIGTSKSSFNGYTISLKGKEEKEAFYINNLTLANFVFEGEETFYRITQNGSLRVLQNNDNRILQNG